MTIEERILTIEKAQRNLTPKCGEIMIYFGGDNKWFLEVGNGSCVMLGEVTGIGSFSGESLEDVLTQAEKHYFGSNA